MKILVADDEQAVRESLRRSLRFNGYDVVLAEDGEDALDQIRVEQPDLTILDLMMPKLDGLGVCRTLRSSGYDGPILMLTSRFCTSCCRIRATCWTARPSWRRSGAMTSPRPATHLRSTSGTSAGRPRQAENRALSIPSVGSVTSCGRPLRDLAALPGRS